jgi:hypothetical protein
MAASPVDERVADQDDVAGTGALHPLKAAALVGGALAATAGAYYGTRALARRNAAAGGGKINSVMATAMTACDLAHSAPATTPKARSR